MLILACGNIAAGKSTVAKILQEKIGGVILQTNDVRSLVYPNPTYSEKETAHVYELFFKEVEVLLERQIVILDATFSSQENRKKAISLASSLNKKNHIIEVVGPEDTETKKRIDQRQESINKTNFEQYLKVKNTFDPVIEKRTIINNDGSLNDLKKQINLSISSLKQ